MVKKDGWLGKVNGLECWMYDQDWCVMEMCDGGRWEKMPWGWDVYIE